MRDRCWSPDWYSHGISGVGLSLSKVTLVRFSNLHAGGAGCGTGAGGRIGDSHGISGVGLSLSKVTLVRFSNLQAGSAVCVLHQNLSVGESPAGRSVIADLQQLGARGGKVARIKLDGRLGGGHAGAGAESVVPISEETVADESGAGDGQLRGVGRLDRGCGIDRGRVD